MGAEHTVLYSEAGRNCVTGRKGEYSETDIQGNSVTQSAINPSSKEKEQYSERFQHPLHIVLVISSDHHLRCSGLKKISARSQLF